MKLFCRIFGHKGNYYFDDKCIRCGGFLSQDKKAEPVGKKCARCGRVPEVSYEDCPYGKEIEDGGTEPHLFSKDTEKS